MAKRGSELFSGVTGVVNKWAPGQKVILDTSWAVWKEPGRDGFSRTSDVSFPDEAIAREHAHARVIILGMNPGDDTQRGDWSNFHHSWTSRDQLLAEACRGTRLWGALMTDLYSDQYQSKSELLDSSASRASVGVARLLELIKVSREDDPLVVCLGWKTYDGVARGLKALVLNADETRQAAPHLTVVRATHYSGAAAGKHKNDPKEYRRLLHEEITAAGFGDLL